MTFVEIGDRFINLDNLTIVEYSSSRKDKLLISTTCGKTIELNRKDSVKLMGIILEQIEGGGR